MPVRVERETEPETETERIERKILEAQPTDRRERPSGAGPAAAARPASLDPLVKEIEDILSADLGPMYRTMSPSQQRVFRVEGERTAAAVRRLLEQAKLKVKTILDLIRRWLRLIPGVSKFFLEQEAKIKTDRVLAVRDRLHHR
ncbi:MAG: hypothetical protein HY421_01325 [Candidatus Kerfeldbacteria bacterium]|nr:hypothetical protein [Candidatus Kerfeldbacteria bacterium]